MSNYIVTHEMLEQMHDMRAQGFSVSDIALRFNTSKTNVRNHLSSLRDSVLFLAELKRHADFFKGLSPREEYAKHAEFRKTIDEF